MNAAAKSAHKAAMFEPEPERTEEDFPKEPAEMRQNHCECNKCGGRGFIVYSRNCVEDCPRCHGSGHVVPDRNAGVKQVFEKGRWV